MICTSVFRKNINKSDTLKKGTFGESVPLELFE